MMRALLLRSGRREARREKLCVGCAGRELRPVDLGLVVSSCELCWMLGEEMIVVEIGSCRGYGWGDGTYV